MLRTASSKECELGISIVKKRVSVCRWELPVNQQPLEWQRSRLRSVLMPCLSRDPAQRPAAATLMARVTHLGHATTTHTLDAAELNVTGSDNSTR
jgi:hypothetical protein